MFTSHGWTARFIVAVTATTGMSAAIAAPAAGASAAGTASPAARGYQRIIAWGDNSFGQSYVPAGLTDVRSVSAGDLTSLALKTDGTVVEWGWGADEPPTAVPAGLTGVTAIAAGGDHNLALKADGTVVAWGYDRDGDTDVPAGLSGVTAIAASYHHDLALKSDGTVVGWGNDYFGQSDVPAGLNDVTAIAAGSDFSLALKSDGTVVVWGDETTEEDVTPMPPGLDGVIAIAASYFHILALKSDGTVVSWGNNLYDETQVPAALAGVSAIAGGEGYSLALKGDGTVVAWGDLAAALPDTLTAFDARTYAIAAGRDHALALTLGPDATAPHAEITSPTALFTLAGSVDVGFTGSDEASGIATYDLRFRRAVFSRSFGDWIYPAGWRALPASRVSASMSGLLKGYEYCFAVRATDRAGNASPWSTSRCIARAVDDRALSTSEGWVRATGSDYWNGTVTRTRSHGATATLTGAHLDRVAVVATRGPRAGSLGVYVGQRLIGTINLFAPQVHYRSILPLPRFAYRIGTVTLRVRSSGRPVQLDGLAVTRS